MRLPVEKHTAPHSQQCIWIKPWFNSLRWQPSVPKLSAFKEKESDSSFKKRLVIEYQCHSGLVNTKRKCDGVKLKRRVGGEQVHRASPPSDLVIWFWYIGSTQSVCRAQGNIAGRLYFSPHREVSDLQRFANTYRLKSHRHWRWATAFGEILMRHKHLALPLSADRLTFTHLFGLFLSLKLMKRHHCKQPETGEIPAAVCHSAWLPQGVKPVFDPSRGETSVVVDLWLRNISR